MKNTVRVPLFVLALILAAPAFATTPADNIAWSAKPVRSVYVLGPVTGPQANCGNSRFI